MPDLRIGGALGFKMLRALSVPPAEGAAADLETVHGESKLEADFGKDVWRYFEGRIVLDFGSGGGQEAIAVARRGARQIYGLEIQDKWIRFARRLAEERSAKNCTFLNAIEQKDELDALQGKIDCVYSLDGFEHFDRPEQILTEMLGLLRPGGIALINFGPPWNHPYGAHMRYFTRVPWVHRVFAEETILAVRSQYRDDGAKRFEDVTGGLNRMTVKRFLALVRSQGFKVDQLRLSPVGGFGFLTKVKFLRESFTSTVQCVLIKP